MNKTGREDKATRVPSYPEVSLGLELETQHLPGLLLPPRQVCLHLGRRAMGSGWHGGVYPWGKGPAPEPDPSSSPPGDSSESPGSSAGFQGLSVSLDLAVWPPGCEPWGRA